VFEIENDSDWSQFKLAGIDIIDIFYVGLPPGVDLYVSKTTSAIRNNRTHSGTKQIFKNQVTYLIEIGNISNNWTAHMIPFYLTSSGTRALLRISLCGLSGINLNLHHTEGSSSDTYSIFHSTNIQTQAASE
jgi:hypothetical protein